MNLLRLIFRELVALFVDDEKLALAILAVVGACGLLVRYQQGASITVGLLLLFGCIGVLFASAVQGARR